ncbi:MAG: aldehyde dehydrogenase family protein [Deltaproteobacteria bacterium]|nr:aldehyde dehydrogenase family protein [Deltaproteobacteria bacterium]
MSELIVVRNPATNEELGRVESVDFSQAKEALRAVRQAQIGWQAAGLEHRCSVIRRFRDVLLDRADEVCELLSKENGKVLQESLQMEVFPITDLASYFADHAEEILAPRKINLHLLKHRRSTIDYRPRGVVLVISPWNFPFSIPFGETVMALLAGNGVLLKPASLTPLIALKGQELFREAGLDEDLLRVIPCPGQIASRLIDEGVDYVNFTGSTDVGLRVAELCGRNLTPCSLELGGKDPAIVLPDADVDVVCGSLVWGAFANAGQVCASIERAYVHESLYDSVVQGVVQKTSALKVGNPLLDGTDMGPMTDAGQLRVVENQVAQAVERGAKVLTGGRRVDGPGQFFEPTVLVDVDDQMDVVRQETFGPTLPIMRYSDLDDAIARANNSPYGLNAYVYSRDKEAARQVAQRLEAGTVMVNETLFTHACPETPWSGVKKSGIGRVHSDDGLRDLCIPYHINEEVLPTMKWSPFWQPYSHAMYRSLLGAARLLTHSALATRAGGALSLVEAVYQLVKGRKDA